MSTQDMKIWYLAVEGKPTGPFSENQILNLIRNGEVKFSNLVYRQGMTKWVFIAECPEFERRRQAQDEYRPAKVAAPQNLDTNSWILLSKQVGSNGKPHFVQSGPFTTEQVAEKLVQGSIKYSDHIWRSGYEAWATIGSVSEFDRRRFEENLNSDTVVTPPKPDVEFPLMTKEVEFEEAGFAANPQISPAAELQTLRAQPETPVHVLNEETVYDPNPIGSMFVAPPAESQAPPAMPSHPNLHQVQQEGSGYGHSTAAVAQEDLTQVLATQKTQQAPQQAPFPEPVVQEAAVPVMAPSSGKFPKTPLWKRPLAAVGVGVTAGFVIFFVGFRAWVQTNPKYQDKITKLMDNAKGLLAFSEVDPLPPILPPPQVKPAPPTVPTAPNQVAADQGTNAKPSTASSPAVASGAVVQATPTEAAKILKVVGLKLASTQPQLAFETNLPAKTQIEVLITAKLGDILKYPTYRLTKKILVSPGMVPTLDLSVEGLPPGQYTVTAKAGGAQANTPIALGVLDKKFQDRLAEHKKILEKQKRGEVRTLYVGGTKLWKSFAAIRKDYKAIASIKNAENRKNWVGIYKEWKKQHEKAMGFLSRFESGNRNLFVYPELYDHLNEINSQVLQVVRGFDQSFKSGRKIASDANDVQEAKTAIKEFLSNIKDL